MFSPSAGESAKARPGNIFSLFISCTRTQQHFLERTRVSVQYRAPHVSTPRPPRCSFVLGDNLFLLIRARARLCARPCAQSPYARPCARQCAQTPRIHDEARDFGSRKMMIASVDFQRVPSSSVARLGLLWITACARVRHVGKHALERG